MTGSKIIMGIDPGTNLLGFGVIRVEGREVSFVGMGVADMRKEKSHFDKLRKLGDEMRRLLDEYSPDELSIESPFYGKNPQVMLKLGRAQGVAMASALLRDIPIAEYAPLKVKMAITGNGGASKEQVAEMLRRILNIPKENIDPHLDATDALGVALCHFYESSRPKTVKAYKSWKDFIAKNPDKIKK